MTASLKFYVRVFQNSVIYFRKLVYSKKKKNPSLKEHNTPLYSTLSSVSSYFVEIARLCHKSGKKL